MMKSDKRSEMCGIAIIGDEKKTVQPPFEWRVRFHLAETLFEFQWKRKFASATFKQQIVTQLLACKIVVCV